MSLLKKIKAKDQSGVVLLVAMLILSLIVFSAVGLSQILINEIRSARYLDNAVVAHFAAESGAERALFLLKESKGLDENPNMLFNDDISPNLKIPDNSIVTPDTGTFRVDDSLSDDQQRLYQFLNISVDSPDFIVNNVPANATVQFDIYNPIQEMAANIDTDITALNIDWEVENCGGSDRLEVSIYEYEIDSGINLYSPYKLYKTCDCSTTNVCVAVSIPLSSSYFYHVTLRPLDDDVKEIKVQTATRAGTSSIPSQVNIRSQGIFRESIQTVTAQTPWNPGVADIFDYVIFTESSLIKDILTPQLDTFDSLCGFCVNQTADGQDVRCSTAADCLTAGVNGECAVHQPTDAIQPFCPLDNSGTESYNILTSIISQDNTNACNAKCTGYTFCGDGPPAQSPNGALTGGPADDGREDCDDGNTSNKDTCNNSCQFTFCNDKIIQSTNGFGGHELCDDGPLYPGCTVNQCNGCTAVGCCKSDCSGRVTSSGGPGLKCPPDCISSD